MGIVVVCDFCRKRYRFREALAGTIETCEKCGNLLQVPGVANQQAVEPRRNSTNGAAPLPAPLPARPVLTSCPSCAAEVPPEEAYCVGCGYDMREARTYVPVAPWREGPTDRDPTRPAVSDLLYRVGIGLKMTFWDVTLTALINAVLLVAPVMLEPMMRNVQQIAMLYRAYAALYLLWVVVMAIGMCGRAFCLNVPQESQAKGVIIGSVLIESITVLINIVAVIDPHNVSETAESVGRIAALIAHVLFLGFLTRLAGYLRRPDLDAETRQTLALGLVFVPGAIAAEVARYVFPIGHQLFAFGSIFIVPLLFFPYLRLLNRFLQAFRVYR